MKIFFVNFQISVSFLSSDKSNYHMFQIKNRIAVYESHILYYIKSEHSLPDSFDRQ